MIKITGSSYKSLRQGDEDFVFSPDGMTIVPRASFEISKKCPEHYREILMMCLRHDYIRSVANMRDTEYTMELLQK